VSQLRSRLIRVALITVASTVTLAAVEMLTPTEKVTLNETSPSNRLSAGIAIFTSKIRWFGFGCAGHVELSEAAAGVEEGVAARAVGSKEPDDLRGVVNAEGSRKGCAGHVEWGEDAAGVEEAVGARAVGKNPYDLPRVVDAAGLRGGCAASGPRFSFTLRSARRRQP
jgi:hypothetical protein